MVRGIYTAESAMLTAIRDINVKSNNLANLSTAGFKQDRLVTTTFAEALAVRQQTWTTGAKYEIGNVTRGKKALELKTDFTPGSLQETESRLDFAITGDGFFVIKSGKGEYDEEDNPDGVYGGKYYTRNGQFQIGFNEDGEYGYLVNGLGDCVLDEYDEPIEILTDDFRVDPEGKIFVYNNPDPVATLGVYNPRNPDFLIKDDEYSFVILNEETAAAVNENGDEELEDLGFGGKIRQGYIEMSNTDIAGQMAGLITASRSFQSMSQIIRAIDSVVGKSVNEVGRV